MLTDDQINNIQEQLFSQDNQFVYAIIDGAACPDLRFKLYDWQPDSVCLWSGKLEPDLEEVAPYLVQLEKGDAFTNWLITNGWENHWNIFAHSALPMKEFRKAIRKFLLVRSPEGKSLVFRFYDPRVMEIFLPTCDKEQTEELFENVHRFSYANIEKNNLVCARKDKTNYDISITYAQI